MDSVPCKLVRFSTEFEWTSPPQGYAVRSGGKAIFTWYTPTPPGISPVNAIGMTSPRVRESANTRGEELEAFKKSFCSAATRRGAPSRSLTGAAVVAAAPATVFAPVVPKP